MKSIILILILTVNFAYSQTKEVFYFKQALPIKLYDLNQSPPIVTSTIEIAQKGWRFYVDHKITNGYIITFLKWTNDETRNDNFYSTKTTINVKGKKSTIKETKKYFFISDSDYSNATDKYVNNNPKWSFVTGAVTIPIKIRPSGDETDIDGNKIRPFDFTGEVNVGLSFGLRIRLNPNGKGFIIPTAGLNLTSISVDPSTVKNDILTSKTNASSITPFIGVIGEYDNFQLSLLTGWDRLAGKTGENWVYQGKPWFGLGLGYNIFNTKNNSPNNE